MADNLAMEERAHRQSQPVATRADFDALCRAIAEVQQPPSRGFVTLLEMRADARFANQNLAALISRDPESHANLQMSYEANLRTSDIASSPRAPAERPFSMRDAIDHWGYRVCHSSSVANGIVKFLGDHAFVDQHHDFWLPAFAVAAYAVVLAETLGTHDDRALAGSLLRSASLFLLRRHDPSGARAARLLATSNRAPLWEAETQLFGGSHLDLGRRLCERSDLSDELLEVFAPHGEPGSLPDLLFRATATAELHGFEGPAGPIVPPHLRPDREPILEAFFRNSGRTTDGVLLAIQGMLANTPLVNLDTAA